MKDNRVDIAKKIITEHVKDFTDHIQESSNKNHPYLQGSNTQWHFKVFCPDNQFPLLARYEESLERSIRDYLVTNILFDFFSSNQILPDWKIHKCNNDMIPNYNITISNYSFNDLYPLVFIIFNNSIRIGISYFTDPNDKTIDLLERYALDKIVVIRFDDDPFYSYTAKNKYIDYLTIKQFLFSYFPEEIVNTYLNEVTYAIKRAKNQIGYQIIPTLSIRSIADFKTSIINSLNRIDTSEMKLHQDDIEILNHRFYDQNLLLTVIGTSDFAKCFITSEYLFRISQMISSCSIDYTSIVLGYFKAIELLLSTIMELWLSNNAFHDAWINTDEKNRFRIKQESNSNNWRYKNAKQHKIPQVRFKPENKEFFKTEIESLVWFINDNSRGWLLSQVSIDSICRFLLTYKSNWRNEYIHKELIHDSSLISEIRAKTILALFCLLGGCKQTESIVTNDAYLNPNHMNYDRLYNILKDPSKTGWNYYLIQLPNNDSVLVYFYDDQEIPLYDKMGHVSSELTFFQIQARNELKNIRIKDFDNYIKSKPKFSLSPNNLPSRIWYITDSEEKIEIKWKTYKRFT